MMRYLIPVILVLAMCFAVACGDDGDDGCDCEAAAGDELTADEDATWEEVCDICESISEGFSSLKCSGEPEVFSDGVCLHLAAETTDTDAEFCEFLNLCLTWLF